MTTPPMNILKGLQGLRSVARGCVLSVGNFDGMHLGHQRIIETARALRASGARVTVVTFEPHPLTVLRPGHAPPRLTAAPMKRELLARAGVDDLVELAPDRDVLDLTAEDFWRILRDDVRPTHMIEGTSFTFGKGRAGNIDTLRGWAASSGVKLEVVAGVSVALCDLSVVQVSSSLIRWLVAHGRMRDAGICLGRAYALRGEVIRGHQRGRSIGVPTANLAAVDQLIPADGVYSGRATLDGKVYRAAVSVGTMPTFGSNPRQVEAHLIGFQGDLYGQTLEVELTGWIRDQRPFPGVEALKAQLTRDIVCADQQAACATSAPVARIV